ncbi:MAG: hypothetical protein SV862_00230 [Pseudomonadota bacterium]|nr:hypothetical protein [Pseudomonadota bacterium]
MTLAARRPAARTVEDIDREINQREREYAQMERDRDAMEEAFAQLERDLVRQYTVMENQAGYIEDLKQEYHEAQDARSRERQGL